MRLPDDFRRAYKSAKQARVRFGSISFARPVIDHVPYGLSEWEAKQIKNQVDVELAKENKAFE